MTEQAIEFAIRHADGWVVRNLRDKHNSVYPANLITCEADVRIGQKLLTCIVGTPVKIRETEFGYICEI